MPRYSRRNRRDISPLAGGSKVPRGRSKTDVRHESRGSKAPDRYVRTGTPSASRPKSLLHCCFVV